MHFDHLRKFAAKRGETGHPLVAFNNQFRCPNDEPAERKTTRSGDTDKADAYRTLIHSKFATEGGDVGGGVVVRIAGGFDLVMRQETLQQVRRFGVMAASRGVMLSKTNSLTVELLPLAALLLGPHCVARSLFGLSRRRTPFLKSLLSRLVFLLDSFPDSLSCFFIHSEDYTDVIGTTYKPLDRQSTVAAFLIATKRSRESRPKF